MGEKPTFQELMDRVRGGDDAAARDLIREYEPAVRRMLRFGLPTAACGRHLTRPTSASPSGASSSSARPRGNSIWKTLPSWSSCWQGWQATRSSITPAVRRPRGARCAAACGGRGRRPGGCRKRADTLAGRFRAGTPGNGAGPPYEARPLPGRTAGPGPELAGIGGRTGRKGRRPAGAARQGVESSGGRRRPVAIRVTHGQASETRCAGATTVRRSTSSLAEGHAAHRGGVPSGTPHAPRQSGCRARSRLF